MFCVDNGTALLSYYVAVSLFFIFAEFFVYFGTEPLGSAYTLRFQFFVEPSGLFLVHQKNNLLHGLAALAEILSPFIVCHKLPSLRVTNYIVRVISHNVKVF